MKHVIQQRILAPLKALLSEGLSPAKLGLALSVGFVLGVTPMLGIASIMAVVVAYGLKLNQVGIQLGNYAAYPLQILLFIPFIRAGEWLLGIDAANINPNEIAMMFSEDLGGSLASYGHSLFGAFVAWLLLAIPSAWVLRIPLQWLLQKYGPKQVS